MTEYTTIIVSRELLAEDGAALYGMIMEQCVEHLRGGKAVLLKVLPQGFAHCTACNLKAECASQGRCVSETILAELSGAKAFAFCRECITVPTCREAGRCVGVPEGKPIVVNRPGTGGP